MIIKQIKGNYGVLQGETFSFNKGMNIINRENEWGKTTLISLIKVMIYGLDTSKRDKKDCLSEKTKYTSQVNFSGQIDIEKENEQITVLRSQDAKTMNFSAFFTQTGMKCSYTSKDFGESIVGVKEEVFCNSALIEADNRLISKNSELLELILSLTTTGDVSKTFDKATKSLKDKKNKLLKATGILQTQKERLLQIEDEILQYNKITEQLLKLNKVKNIVEAELLAKRERYEKEYRQVSMIKLEISERANILKRQSKKILDELEKDFYQVKDIENAKKAYANFAKLEEVEYKLRLELNQLKLNVSAEINQLNQKRKEQIAENSKVKVRKIPFLTASIFGVCAFLSMFMDLDLNFEYSTYILSGIAIIALYFSFSANKNYENINEIFDEQIEILNKNIENIQKEHKSKTDKIEESFKIMVHYAGLIGETNAHTKEDVKNRIFFVTDIHIRYKKALEFSQEIKNDGENIYELENVRKNEGHLQEIKEELTICEENFAQITSEILKYNLKLDQTTPKNKLMFEKENLTKEIFEAEHKILSLDIALNVLNQANTNLTARLSPQISKKATEYFAFLTYNKYDTVILQQDFEAFCKSPSTFSLLSKLHLSQGTKEQLYFSLRLAICDVLLNENTPIILDDPFVFYDDIRMKRAMDLLLDISNTRQILLFTCQDRQEKYINVGE